MHTVHTSTPAWYHSLSIVSSILGWDGHLSLLTLCFDALFLLGLFKSYLVTYHQQPTILQILIPGPVSPLSLKSENQIGGKGLLVLGHFRLESAVCSTAGLSYTVEWLAAAVGVSVYWIFIVKNISWLCVNVLCLNVLFLKTIFNLVNLVWCCKIS